MSIKINARQAGDVSILEISGRLTLGEGVSTLRNTLSGMAKEGRKKILLDLGDLTYLDSSGIGVLVASFATLTNQGGQLKLLRLTNRVKDLLLLTKLYTVFEVFDDETSALRSLAEISV